MIDIESGLISIIDLGTGSIRNSVYDFSGSRVECVRIDNPVIYSHGSRAEQDTSQWWVSIRDSYAGLPIEVRDRIIAISVTSQREGIVPVDTTFKPLDNMIIWLDGRTDKEALHIEDTLGRERIYDICGLVHHPVWSLSKILWLKNNKPDIYKNAFKLLQAEDYVISRLTGTAVSEFSIASRTCLLNVKEKTWSGEIIKAFDLNRDQLPELRDPGSFVGRISSENATLLGLDERVRVFMGAGDQQAAAVGTGAVFEGAVSIGIGTSSALSCTISKPVFEENRNIILNCAAIPGMWEYEPPIWNTGGLIKWFFDEFEQLDKDSYGRLLEETLDIPPASDGLRALPYFSGSGSPRWNPDQKGCFYGLKLSHSKLHLLKALMEGVAFEIKLNVESVLKAGIVIKKIILSGGASRNLPLCKVISDVLQMPVDISSETEASSLGCFILTKASLENSSDYEGIFKAVEKGSVRIEPEARHEGPYRKAYLEYVRLGNLFDEHGIK